MGRFAEKSSNKKKFLKRQNINKFLLFRIIYVGNLDYPYKVWKEGLKLFYVKHSKIYHKVGASSGEEVSEFSAYWYYKNSLVFRFEQLRGLYKISSISYYFLRMSILILKWWIKNHKIIIPLLKGIKHAIYRN